MSYHHLVELIARSAVHGVVYRAVYHSPALACAAIFLIAAYVLTRPRT